MLSLVLAAATAVGCVTVTESPRSGCRCYDAAGKPVETRPALCLPPGRPIRLERFIDDKNGGPREAD